MDIRNSKVGQLFGSVKLTLVLLLALAVVTAAATLIESANGTAYAQALVYRTWWFEAILILFAINMIVMFLVRWPFPRTQIGFMITHFSVIVILIGAGVTRFFGYEGVMTIREGSSSDFIFSREDHLGLSIAGAKDTEEINLYRPGTQNIRRTLEVGGEPFELAVLEYWPHMDRRLREDPAGAPMLQMVAAAGGSPEAVALEVGKPHAVEDASVQFLGAGPLPSTTETAGRGIVTATLGSAKEEFPVPAELPAEFAIEGQKVRLVELNPDFKVGREADPDAPMRNPSLRLEVVGSDGRTFQKQHFALHPEFVMGDSLTGAAQDLSLGYTWSRTIYLALDANGQVQGTAEFPLEISAPGHNHTGGDNKRVEAGTSFSLSDGEAIQTNGFSLRLDRAWQSASWGRGPSMNENAPAGARVEIVDSQGNRAEEYVFVGQGEQDIRLGDRMAQVSIGPIRIPVGYQVHLDDFVLVTYPGSNNPASFESHVRLTDKERGIEGEQVRIYMNHPLTYRGFKHFQSSYDSDRRGTVLSVNHDPGKWPTYVGYFLMTLGFIITLSRGLLWNRNPQPMQQMTRRPATKRTAAQRELAQS